MIVSACSGSPDDPGDEAGADFGDARQDALAQGPLARAMLAMLNDPALAFDELDDDAGLNRNAVEAIFDHRDGPDGEPGSADDDLFDSLEELDAVDRIGPKALGRLLDHTARTRKPATVHGQVIQTIVTGLEIEHGDFCVFIAATEAGERIGFTDATGDCFAGNFSEHPEDEIAMFQIAGADLEFLTDPAEIDELRELQPSAFYLRLTGPVDTQTPTRTVGCVSTEDGEPLIEAMQLRLGGETFRLARGFLLLGFNHPINDPDQVLEDGFVDPFDGELAMPVDSVMHGEGSSSFELRGDELTMAFELDKSKPSRVTVTHDGDTFESVLDCEF